MTTRVKITNCDDPANITIIQQGQIKGIVKPGKTVEVHLWFDSPLELIENYQQLNSEALARNDARV